MKINKGCVYKKGDNVLCIKSISQWNSPARGQTYTVIFSRFLCGEEYIYITTTKYRDWKKNRLIAVCDYYPVSLFNPENKNVVRRSKLLKLKTLHKN